MRRRNWIGLMLSLISAAPLPAQEVAPSDFRLIPRGAHSFHVFGTGMGADMPPWISQMTVRDTTMAGGDAVMIHAGSRLDVDGWRFNVWTVLRGLPPAEMQVRSMGRGRGGGASCETRVRDGLVEVTTSTGVSKHGPFDMTVLPEMAAAYIIAAMPLRDGLKVSVRLYRCEDAGASEPVRSWVVNAAVTSGEHARVPGAAPEAVWMVNGDADYPYHLIVAKKDRMVLRYELPQGSMGSMVAEYRGTR